MSDSAEKSTTTSVPPYVAHKTFKSFLGGLKVAMPARIDRSVMSTYSGAVQAQLVTALKFFGLVGPHGHPTEKLVKLVGADGQERVQLLQAMVRDGYPWIFQKEVFDLASATSSQMAEQFGKAGASGETIRKGIAFLLPLLKDAEINLSPHIKGAPKRVGGGGRSKRVKPAVVTPTPSASVPAPAASPAGWSEMLLSKFPSFDPAWPDEVKKQWFDGFDKLMSAGNVGKPGNNV